MARTGPRSGMSNGDDADEEPADEPVVSEAEALNDRLDGAAEELEAAETEADLDAVEAELDDVEEELDVADLPEPDEDEEDAEDPREELESRISDLREDLEEQRGPYAEDVTDVLADARATLTEAEWTETGADEAVAAVDAFLAEADEYVSFGTSAGDSPAEAASAVEQVESAVASTDLDPDEDADAIAGLLEISEALADDLDAAETWEDLTVQEQLQAEGFYDALESESLKDFPPEWSALKRYGREGEVEPILYALEKLGDSDFFEEYVYDELVHMGKDAQAAFDEIHQRAQKRDKAPIRILGKMGDDRAAETLHEFIEGDGDPALQKVTLRALGELGSEESVQPVAQRLVAEDDEVRSMAARALGLLGDTRAIEPLADVLEDDDSDAVRASAAWALRQIGTERALDVASEYADDRAYLVQAEAEKAASV